MRAGMAIAAGACLVLAVRSNSRLPTTLNARDQPPAEVSDQRVSGLTGAVHDWAARKECVMSDFASRATNH